MSPWLGLLFACQTADVPAPSVPDEPDSDTASVTTGASDTGSTGSSTCPVTWDNWTRGFFATYCTACHGAEGEGNELGPGLEHEMHHTDQQLVDIILKGKKEMAPVDCTEDEAWLIVGYMHELFPDA